MMMLIVEMLLDDAGMLPSVAEMQWVGSGLNLFGLEPFLFGNGRAVIIRL